jgi:predicted RNA binding protein YcfA (HicA-like mRNA interferase family)
MEKRRDLVRHLADHGCRLLRQGRNHEVWIAPTGRRSTVPRHREIPRGTARAICDQLGVPRL